MYKLLTVLVVLIAPCVCAAQADENCAYFVAGAKQVFWGDLHVHSGYSLDAWGYGTSASPTASYAFARGAPLTLPGGTSVSLARPLDFMAVTDHAEWFNLMYMCTDPEWSDAPYCNTMTDKNAPQTGVEVFAEYVIPTITLAKPQPTALCDDNPKHCERAKDQQWGRIQEQARQANDPCNFTSFIGFEWSATPDFSHNHRNVIFANDNVTPEAIDYMNYPTPQKLWAELDRQCRPENGCDVLAIPHNTNMGDGKSFDVESEADDIIELRSRYERLVEVHQEKGNSECLPAFGQTDEDCGYELYLTRNSRPTERNAYTEAEWEKMRSGYVRGLLLKGLAAYDGSRTSGQNPLQLGMIGSTDNHAGAGGFVEEDEWLGSVFGIGDFDRTMTRRSWNPGGLVAVWAEQNTRASLFAALKRREVYATSGPRIRTRLLAAPQPLDCASDQYPGAVPMGGDLPNTNTAPYFLVQAQYDRTPIASIEIIKGELTKDGVRERVMRVWHNESGGLDVCATWQDEEFDAAAPAFWYARIKQAPTPRWSAHHCAAAGRCDEFPDANVTTQERAWTSPIWHLPQG